jgi:hypothetical protein
MLEIEDIKMGDIGIREYCRGDSFIESFRIK